MTNFAEARSAMVNSQLRTNAVFDHRVLSAMGQVPRELFVPDSRRSVAYVDDTQPFSDEEPHRRMAAPAAFARLIQLAEIAPDDRVLDVGAGTGYSAAVLAHMAGSVEALEPDPALAQQAKRQLNELGLANVTVTCAPIETLPKGPYDVIVIEGALDVVPEAYFTSLAEGGRLVALLQSGPIAVAYIFIKHVGNVTSRAEYNSSMPPLAPKAPADVFVF